MAYDRLAAGGKDLGPKYRLRGDRAGASGHSRSARLKSRSRECRPPLRPPSAAFFSFRFLPVVSRRSRVRCSLGEGLSRRAARVWLSPPCPGSLYEPKDRWREPPRGGVQRIKAAET